MHVYTNGIIKLAGMPILGFLRFEKDLTDETSFQPLRDINNKCLW